MGEQGLYGHAFYHEKVMEVPILIFRLNAPPHAAPAPSVVVERDRSTRSVAERDRSTRLDEQAA